VRGRCTVCVWFGWSLKNEECRLQVLVDSVSSAVCASGACVHLVYAGLCVLSMPQWGSVSWCAVECWREPCFASFGDSSLCTS
jgi:hypothetical protein